MSHNVLDIGGNTPSRTGNISSIATGDLGDVSGSPSSSEALTYNSGWAPATAPTAGTQESEVVGWIGGDYSNIYSLGNAKQPTAGLLYRFCYAHSLYRPLYYQNTSHCTWKTSAGNAFTSAGGYADRAELVAGTYRFNFRHVAYSGQSAPFLDVRWETYGGDPLGPIRRISEAGVPCNVSAAGKFSATTTVVLKVITHAGNCRAPYTNPPSPTYFNRSLQLSIVRIA